MEHDRGRFDEGAATEPLARETPYGTQPHEMSQRQQMYESQMRPGGYGYRSAPWGWGAGFGRRRRAPIETRPFFLTSEFLVTVLAIVALGITAGVMDIVDARLTWILTAAMVFGYVVSRGLAKAGNRSHSFDPREQFLERGDGGAGREAPEDRAADETSYAPASQPAPGRYGARPGPRWPIETKPFFLTSEFLGTLLAIVALAITAASMDNLGARLTWILIAAMVFTYVLSRGIAKAGTRSYSFDPREQLLGRDPQGRQEQMPEGSVRPVRSAIETKPFFLTSEFLGTLLAIVAIAISGAAIDILDVRLTWILITAMVCGYVLSRGLAKIGIKSHALDPREQFLRSAATGSGAEQRQSVTQR